MLSFDPSKVSGRTSGRGLAMSSSHVGSGVDQYPADYASVIAAAHNLTVKDNKLTDHPHQSATIIHLNILQWQRPYLQQKTKLMHKGIDSI